MKGRKRTKVSFDMPVVCHIGWLPVARFHTTPKLTLHGSLTFNKSRGTNNELYNRTNRISKDRTVGSSGSLAGICESVVDSGGFENWDRVLFHTDEAMSWETVRNLNRMPPLVLIIRNLCIQGGASSEIMLNLEEITNILEETLSKFPC
jgi:hypothetical protein